MMNKIYKNRGAKIFLFLLFVCLPPIPASAGEHSAASFFTYAELTTLYEQGTLPQPIEAKLNKLLTIPFVENLHASATPPRFSQSMQLGEFLRVAHWNIERGLEYDAIEAVFASGEQFAAMLEADKFPLGSDERQRALKQAAMLRAADVIVLNEVDFGMKRTEYRNIAADLAARLKMNYAFGVQFVELSPVRLSQELENAGAEEKEISEVIKVDPSRYKGLHGIAILSRFPLENVRLVPFKNQPYDWYKSEKDGASLLEKGKRKIAGKIFSKKPCAKFGAAGALPCSPTSATCGFRTGA
jgi:hypothetical protein